LFAPPQRLIFLRSAMTLALALAAALVCLRVHAPLPWTIGPLLATALLSMAGAPTFSWTPLRNGGQWVIGAALGLYFTPQVVALVATLWWAIALNIAWALTLGLLLGRWLYWLHRGDARAPGWRQRLAVPGLTRATAYFTGPIGAASEMTLMAERHGGHTGLVASAHSLRVLLVTLVVPFGFQWAGLQGIDANLPAVRAVSLPGLAVLGGLTGLGCWAMLRLKRTNPWFIGALAASLLLTAGGVVLSGIPQALTNAAQLAIGISLGVRFTPAFIHVAPRWLGSVAVASIALIALCAAFGWLLAWASGMHWATVVLGVAPGGIAEMAITAKVLQLGVALVTALHVTRLAAVLVLVEPLYFRLHPPGIGPASADAAAGEAAAASKPL
jgi:uncharacterized protein